MNLTLGISPCPNDTFIFDALVNGKINTRGYSFSTIHEDVETLNRMAFAQELDMTKLSFAAWCRLSDKYTLLNSGAALGRGVGPLLVQRAGGEHTDVLAGPVAIPGEHTTAHFLFEQFYPKHTAKRFMPFNEIEHWLLQQPATAPAFGVLIHENRFTYRERGLELVADLGTAWEQRTGLPIPLGGIAIKKEFSGEVVNHITELVRESLAWSWNRYPQLSDYITGHAQEMEEEVMRKHIQLYVNEYTVGLNNEAWKAIELMQQMWKPK
ncbi:MAG: 1,4-dihydroxy-6-naphthoate synthase [Dinghuibacter sp.]|nr:1,4-dihydroxy-6-naphthoate synthase [Dinghuibacter sp.]